MGASKNGAMVAAILTFALAACSGSTARDAGPDASATGGDAAGAQGGEAEGGGSGVADAAGAAGAGATDNACEERHDGPPGPAIDQLSKQGSGACAGTTLADAVAQVRALRPDLSDVTELYNPNPDTGDGSFIYAFGEADGGFALVFKRGGGDCPAGCTVNDYWYFEAGAACHMKQVGETHDSGSCTPPDELPRWGVPAAVAPRDICGADLSPVQLSGSYDLVSCGSASACALAGKPLSSRTLPSPLSLKIVQRPDDLSQGTVTLDGTGEALLDAQPLPATFDRQSFVVHVDYSNLPATCLEAWQIDITYDFEGFGTRHLRLFQSRTPDCTNAPNAYCKGELNADLGEAQLRR